MSATIDGARRRYLAFEEGYEAAKNDPECRALNPYKDGDRHGADKAWLEGYATCKMALDAQDARPLSEIDLEALGKFNKRVCEEILRRKKLREME